MARDKSKSKHQKSDRKKSQGKSASKSQRKNVTRLRTGRHTKAQSELQKIEAFLGEDFESLADARRALQSDTGAKPHKKSYTVGELSTKKHNTIKTFLTDLDDHKEDVNLLKNPDDFWAAEIYGNKTYFLYPRIEALASKLGTYRGLQEEHPKQALKNINIIRVKGIEATKYYDSKRKQVAERWEKRKQLHKADLARERQQASKLKKLQKQIKVLKARLRKTK